MHKNGRYREVQIPASKGFLIPKVDAEKYALKIIYV